MNVLMGIGNEDRGDDAAGILIARRLRHPEWTPLECGTAPENFTGVVRRLQPVRLVLADAMHMGLAPGAVRRVPRDRIEDAGIGTHMLPLHHLIDFLADCAGEIVLVGIQPRATEYGDALSPEVLAAVEQVAVLLAEGHLESIPVLQPSSTMDGA
jgi:hydrogenase 3 maturation protease